MYKRIYKQDNSDILFIESLIHPRQKVLMSNLGIKLRTPIHCEKNYFYNRQMKTNPKVIDEYHDKPATKSLTNLPEIDKRVADNYNILVESYSVCQLDDESHSVHNENTVPGTITEDDIIALYKGEIVFAISEDTVELEKKASEEKHNQKRQTPGKSLQLYNPDIAKNPGIKDVIFTNMKDYYKNTLENLDITNRIYDNYCKEIIKDDKATKIVDQEKISERLYLSENMPELLEKLKNNELKIQSHQIKNQLEFGRNISVNSIQLSTTDGIKEAFNERHTNIFQKIHKAPHNSECLKSARVYNLDMNSDLFEIHNCLRICDLKRSNLYGKMKKLGNNNKFQENYFQIKSYSLICYNGSRKAKSMLSLPDLNDLSIPNNPDFFYTEKYSINILRAKIFLVLNKKIKGFLSSITGLFTKEKKEYIDITDKLLRNVVDLKNGYKVAIYDNELETVYTVPVLEFCIEFQEKMYHYRVSNSSTFLRWIFALMSRAGNKRYISQI